MRYNMNKLFRGVKKFFTWQVTIAICLLLEANFIWMAYLMKIELATISFALLIATLLFGLKIQKEKQKKTNMTHRFYKDIDGIWYIDLPAFLESGLGTKANLMMVAGADTFLDKLSNDGDDVTVHIETAPYAEQEYALTKLGFGLDKALLSAIGHAPVEYGAYYRANDGHVLWLCPVTEYVFGGSYPKDIYVNVVK